MKNKTFAILLLLSILLGVTGCSSEKSETVDDTKTNQEEDVQVPENKDADDTKKSEVLTMLKDMTVAFIPKQPNSSFYEFSNESVQKYADIWGIYVTYIDNFSDTPEGQADAVRQALTLGVDAICISVADADAVSEALQEAADANVIVCTWESDAHPEDRSLMISPGTPESIGEMLVQMGVDSLEKRGINPETDTVNYCWHYSRITDKDQNFWQYEGELYIAKTYPNWENIAPDNYYSAHDPEQAVAAGAAALKEHPDVDLILCNDSAALLGQLQAAQDANLTGENITITGLASPGDAREYYEKGLLYEWGLWDCQTLASIGCYTAAYLAAGNSVSTGDTITVPEIGKYTIESNDAAETGTETADKNHGVIFFQEYLLFNDYNIDDYDF